MEADPTEKVIPISVLDLRLCWTGIYLLTKVIMTTLQLHTEYEGVYLVNVREKYY